MISNRIKISSFTDVVTGGTPSTAIKAFWENGIIPWINSGDLNQERISRASNFITQAGYDNSSAQMMPANTVVIALTGATTGKVAILNIEACGNQSVTGILPSKEHDPEYLYFYLRTQRQIILDKAWGGAQPHISQKYVKDYLVPLPSIEHQILISRILSKAEQLIAKRKESIQLLDEFLKSTFLEMFGDPSTNRHQFKKGIIRDLANDVKYGTSKPADANGKYPYLRMNNITSSGYIDLSDLKFINLDDKEKEKYIVKRGDLLFNRTNSKELVGKTCVFNENAEMAIAGYLIRMRMSEKANPWFIWGYLNSSHGKQTLFGMCKSIVGMANINAQELQDIKILIPPIKIQNQFAQIVEKTEALKVQYQQSLQELQNLYNALSQKAFKDELFKKEEAKIIPISAPNAVEDKAYFKRAVLAAYIINQSLNDSQFGDVKFQKLLHLAEHHVIKRNLKLSYFQKAAGPYDNKFMHWFFDYIKNQKWFIRQKNGIQFFFKSGNKHSNSLNVYNYFSKEELENINKLINHFKKSNYEEPEIISTLYAVWNNRIILQQPVSDDLLKNDFLQWDMQKIKYKDRLDKALDWMRNKNIIPNGWGSVIKKPSGKKS